jgi:hypothetical protein
VSLKTLWRRTKLIAINGGHIWPRHIAVLVKALVPKPRSFVEWLHSELILLPDTMSKVGDYGVATYCEMLLHLLEQQGCDHFKAFGSRSFEFPTPEDVPAPRKTIDLINKIILRNFWAKRGRAHSRKKAVDRLTRVRPFDLLQLRSYLLSDLYANA